MLPQHIPMVQTILNTEGDAYSFDYEVKQGRYEQFLATLKELLAKYPKLLVPVLAAVSELFRPAGYPAVYQFATDSVPAKKLINLLVSLFYDRAYEYDSALKEYDTAGSHQHIGNGWEDHHVMLLDTWDLDKTANDELISQLIPFCRKHPGEIHELYPFHVCMTTYDKQFHLAATGADYPFYRDIMYMNTTYGSDQDLQKEYEKLLHEARENGYGGMIDDSVCQAIQQAGDLTEYTIQNLKLKNILALRADKSCMQADPTLAFFTEAYIFPLLSAAQAVSTVWGLDISMDAMEEFLALYLIFRNWNRNEFEFSFAYFRNYVINRNYDSDDDVKVTHYDKPEVDDSSWLMQKFSMPEEKLYKLAKEALIPKFGRKKFHQKFSNTMYFWDTVMQRLRIEEDNGITMYGITVWDYDPTAGLF